MTTEPLFFLGILLLVAAIALIVVVRAIPGAARVLFLIGAVSLVAAGGIAISAARDKLRFRITGVQVIARDSYAGRCPAEHRVQIRVTTAGGEGQVTFRVWADDDLDVPLRTVELAAVPSFDFVTTVPVRRTGLSTAYASIKSPNYQLASDSYRVTCQ